MRKTSHKFGLTMMAGILLYGTANLLLAGDSITLDPSEIVFANSNSEPRTVNICVNFTGFHLKLNGKHPHNISIKSTQNDKGQFYLELPHGENKIFYTIKFIDHNADKEPQNVQPGNSYGLVYLCSLGTKKSELEFTLELLTRVPTYGTYKDYLTVTMDPPK